MNNSKKYLLTISSVLTFSILPFFDLTAMHRKKTRVQQNKTHLVTTDQGNGFRIEEEVNDNDVNMTDTQSVTNNTTSTSSSSIQPEANAKKRPRDDDQEQKAEGEKRKKTGDRPIDSSTQNFWSDFTQNSQSRSTDQTNIYPTTSSSSSVQYSEQDYQKAKSGVNDLVGINLQGADLRNGFDFSGTNLTGANLSGVNAEGVNFSNAILERTNLEGANLKNANLSYAKLIETRLNDTTLVNTNLSNATLYKIKVDHLKILDGTNFINAKILETNFKDSTIKTANFLNAKLIGVNFDTSSIEDTNMRHINAKAIAFIATPLKNINFTLSKIKDLYIAKSKKIGDGLNFQYAQIKKGYIQGEIILQRTKGRTEGITEEMETNPELLIKSLGIGMGVSVGILGGCIGLYLSEKVYDKISDKFHWYNVSNINSILLNTDFHGIKMKDVYFSNIKIANSLNISTAKCFMGCLFKNVISSNRKDIKTLKYKGAKVDLPINLLIYINHHKDPELKHYLKEYDPNFDFIWAKTRYVSYMQNLTTAIIKGFCSDAIAGVSQKVSSYIL